MARLQRAEFWEIQSLPRQSSTTLVWILTYMAKHPDVQKRLRDEVLAAKEKAASEGRGDFTVEELSKEMPYMDAVVVSLTSFGCTRAPGNRDSLTRTILPRQTARDPATQSTGLPDSASCSQGRRRSPQRADHRKGRHEDPCHSGPEGTTGDDCHQGHEPERTALWAGCARVPSGTLARARPRAAPLHHQKLHGLVKHPHLPRWSSRMHRVPICAARWVARSRVYAGRKNGGSSKWRPVTVTSWCCRNAQPKGEGLWLRGEARRTGC